MPGPYRAAPIMPPLYPDVIIAPLRPSAVRDDAQAAPVTVAASAATSAASTAILGCVIVLTAGPAGSRPVPRAPGGTVRCPSRRARSGGRGSPRGSPPQPDRPAGCPGAAPPPARTPNP